MGRTPDNVNFGLFKTDWMQGILIADICERHTMSKEMVVKLRVNLNLPPRNDRAKRVRPAKPKIPDEAEIRARAEIVRAKWDEDTERRRRGGGVGPYVIPTDVQAPDGFVPEWYE